MLVATDIASRSLHVDEVAPVINYDLPKMARTFSTESGGRAEQGSKGAPLDLGGRSRGAGTAPDRTHSQVEDERLQTDRAMAEPPRRMIQNTLASRTLTALPEEMFV